MILSFNRVSLLKLLNHLFHFKTQFLQQAEQDSSAWQKLGERLASLHSYIKALPKQALIIAEAEILPTLQQAISESWQAPVDEPTATLIESPITTDGSDIAWLAQTNVFHHALVFDAVPTNHPDAPALMVLSSVLRNNYLHRTIREQGGAYGGGASYDSNACSFKFYSYRDPRDQATFDDFLGSIDWLLAQTTGEKTDAWIEEAILGLMAGMDKPASPAGEAVKALFAELHGRGKDWQQAMRAKILAVNLDDLQRVARTYLKDKPYTRASLAPFDKAELMQKMGFKVEKVI